MSAPAAIVLDDIETRFGERVIHQHLNLTVQHHGHGHLYHNRQHHQRQR